jgi:hypothetical protein
MSDQDARGREHFLHDSETGVGARYRAADCFSRRAVADKVAVTVGAKATKCDIFYNIFRIVF